MNSDIGKENEREYNIKKYFKKQLDSKKQSDTTLQVFVIFLIFLDFTK